ncbi:MULTISPECIES: DUF1573 domain-containing protein [Flavobacteriaceae]|mgnify:CR=1 FL=1|jgi:hypothetical protein|uniref:DUF1573 domain-containing protein n=2 Tax=Flavobacteriaceae TaxID=49546 RepID=A0ABN1JR35_9FLAO|nr:MULTISPECIES: DUF1573 domain-containing protein [Flavobacteriaceae]RYH71888.1 DUF1573 domain-containing protein [Flavobacteriaceae bacterium 144Ye]TBV26501.1 DUF1573 domain-containing protein [Meridianimaribacter sp. CL38]TDY05790.1 uncharacterized protein DUF1573 [Meridianimaribacter flavus]
MKKVILSLSALCMVAFTSCKEDAASKVKSENVAQAAERDAVAGELPVISFEEAEHDFGTIVDGTPVETKFKYTNTGKAPLVVSNIKSTCGCTVPQDWSREPLAPGESSEFTVKFNGKGKNQITKTITLTTNTEKGSEQVKIKAFIEPDPNAPQKAAGSASIKQVN